VEDGSSGSRTGVARGQQTGQRGDLVLKQSASGVDKSTHRYNCKRAVAGERRVKRDPHRCCKRAADNQKGGLVHRESASGVDNPICICSCKRAYVREVRRAGGVRIAAIRD
jgi:plasmid stabilization system protein ParE